jgi:hypothetical protein
MSKLEMRVQSGKYACTNPISINPKEAKKQSSSMCRISNIKFKIINIGE